MVKNIYTSIIFIVILTLFGSCNKEKKKKVAPPTVDAVKNIQKTADSFDEDILKRKAETGVSFVKQILVMYDKPSPRFGGKKRTKKEALALIKKLKTQLDKKAVSFEQLMQKYSDDPITGPKGDYITVEADGTPSVTKNFSLRLKINEIKILNHDNAFRIIKRIKEPKKIHSPDSKDILKRKPLSLKVGYKTINIAWKRLISKYNGKLAPAAYKRNQTQARKLVLELVAKLKKGANFDLLEEKYSSKIPKAEIPHKHASLTGKPPAHGKHHHKNLDVWQIQNLAIRLKPGEVGVVTSKYGYHIVKRFK